jgi:hypothetical protein
MTKYAEYNGAKHLRPWNCRSTVNYAPGMVFSKFTGGLHIDNLNIPANPGTPAGGNRKTDYQRRQARLPCIPAAWIAVPSTGASGALLQAHLL